MTEEQKNQIVQLCKDHITKEKNGNCRIGWACEQILGSKQPNHIHQKMSALVIKDTRYLRQPSTRFPNDYDIFEDPNYRELTAREKEIEDLTYDKLKLDVKNAKRVYDTYWVTFGFATGALLISLFLLVLKLAELSNK